MAREKTAPVTITVWVPLGGKITDVVGIDANGDKWWNFLFSYDWEGKEYAFDICAHPVQRRARHAECSARGGNIETASFAHITSTPRSISASATSTFS